MPRLRSRRTSGRVTSVSRWTPCQRFKHALLLLSCGSERTWRRSIPCSSVSSALVPASLQAGPRRTHIKPVQNKTICNIQKPVEDKMTFFFAFGRWQSSWADGVDAGCKAATFKGYFLSATPSTCSFRQASAFFSITVGWRQVRHLASSLRMTLEVAAEVYLRHFQLAFSSPWMLATFVDARMPIQEREPITIPSSSTVPTFLKARSRSTMVEKKNPRQLSSTRNPPPSLLYYYLSGDFFRLLVHLHPLFFSVSLSSELLRHFFEAFHFCTELVASVKLVTVSRR